MVTEYAGDFLSMEEGWKAILQFAAEAARIIRIVDPNAGVDVEELAAAESGDALTGFVDKIQTLQLEKSQTSTRCGTSSRASTAGSARRSCSPPTPSATPSASPPKRSGRSRRSSRTAFGGTYTVLSAEAQAPYARRVLYILRKRARRPSSPRRSLQVVTGFAALGAEPRGRAIMEWLKELANSSASRCIARQGRLRRGRSPHRHRPRHHRCQGAAQVGRSASIRKADAQNAQRHPGSRPHIAKGAMDIAKNPQAATAISEAMNARRWRLNGRNRPDRNQ
jgi:hypothetical protein